MRIYKKPNRTQGFTLVELSIVIIIIGFLIAGIAAGQSLIKKAELDAFINDIIQTSSAILQFKSIYGYTPGDMPNASSYWAGTVDGDGDGYTYGHGTEWQYAWSQLNLSKITLVRYYYPDLNFWAEGANKLMPYSHNIIGNLIGYPGSTWPFTFSGGNVIDIYEWNGNDFISSVDAYNMDNKIDDGNPSNGRLFTYNTSNLKACIFGPDGTTIVSYDYNGTDAKYNLAISTPICNGMDYTVDQE